MLNQIFNIQRFAAYSRYSLLVNWRKKAFLALGLILAYIFIIIISLKINHGYNNWEAVTSSTFIIASLIIIGSSFSAFRKKESTMHFLTIPASNIEKFIYELFSKLIALFLFVPLMMKWVGSTCLKIHALIEASRQHLLEAKTYPPLSLDNLDGLQDEMLLPFLIVLAIISILFTGTAVFRKNPLIKTFLFIGSVVTIISSYMFYFTQKLMPKWLSGTTGYMGKSNLNDDQWTNIAITATFVFIIWCLTYAFFKLKEKEI